MVLQFWMEVLVSRPGTSGGWQECVLNRFVDTNPGYPLRFVQFTNLLILCSGEVYSFQFVPLFLKAAGFGDF